MQLDSAYFSICGNWIINYCTQRAWSQARMKAEFDGHRITGLFPESVDFGCSAEFLPCCCPYEHDGTAVSPSATGAPWFNEHNPVSGQFFGFLPSSFTIAAVTDDSDDTLEATMTLVALASTDAGLDHGIEWLQRITLHDGFPVCWMQHCGDLTGHNPNVLTDNGWRHSSDWRRVALTSVDVASTDPNACTQTFTLTLRSRGCITGAPASTVTVDVRGERQPAPAAGLCRPRNPARLPTPSWRHTPVRRRTTTPDTVGRWLDPLTTLSPPATILTDIVPPWSGIQLQIGLNNPTECPWYNIRIDIVAAPLVNRLLADPTQPPQTPHLPATFDEVRAWEPAWIGLVPEIPPNTELLIGQSCGTIQARTPGQPFQPAPGWVLSGAATTLANTPRILTHDCPQRFAVIVFADASVDPDGNPVTPCDVTVCVTTALAHTAHA